MDHPVMKKTLLLLSLLALLLPAAALAQKASELKYVDAKNLMLINQGFDNTDLTYSRLPADMKPATRKAVWHHRHPLDAPQLFHHAPYGRHGHPGHRPLPA